MPEYLAPGVYVEEVSFRPKSIQGVGTSTTAFVGQTRRGPLTESPEVVTSFGEFVRIYGGLADLTLADDTSVTNYMSHAVRSYFDNGGTRLYIGRVFIPAAGSDGIAQSEGIATSRAAAYRNAVESAGESAAATAAAATALAGEAGITADVATETGNAASEATAAAAAATAAVTALNDALTAVAASNGPNLATAQGTIDTQATAAETAATNAETAAADAGTAADAANDADVAAVAGANAAAAAAANVSDAIADLQEFAAGLIAVGDPLFIARMPGSGLNGSVSIFQKATPASLSSIDAAPVGTLIQGTSGTDDITFYLKTADGIDDESGTVVADPAATLGALTLQILTMNIEAADADGNTVFYEGVGFDSAHPRAIGVVLAETLTSKGESLQNPYYYSAPETFTAFHLQNVTEPRTGETAVTFTIADGNDGDPMVNESVEEDAVDVTSALELLEDIDDIAIIAAPGHSALEDEAEYRTIQGALVSHAERLKYRIAVLDTPPDLTPGEARTVKSFIDSKYAALYYPWVCVKNPLARPGQDNIPKEIILPPSGFITGIYARNDIERGVWKAPANEVVRGALRFEREINKRVQETLNPEGINCLRYFPGRGLRVWGARTTSSDLEWNYVNIRRYFIYLEHSIDRSTQWAVFEPNGERLWANIRQTIEGFLYNEWVSGALLGSTPEEAYFVICDRSTMTQADLDAGRLICEIGVAAVKPAEFVIFRIGQKTADARS